MLLSIMTVLLLLNLVIFLFSKDVDLIDFMKIVAFFGFFLIVLVGFVCLLLSSLE
ncbi:hypothetical protein WOSG25_050410 [Weissella oryzae SG25]|uniref:Uncharacterized protein n=1 Tax=Weissella oryzae (strain DSM 25784 / JCM 18191 / LMG 30913 / SG25) TaxID=1329250 RepID=A0A069CTK0_WEIOS|nr:hypothetical protein WOSG25_050410 [Weissella oryzae SG25]